MNLTHRIRLANSKYKLHKWRKSLTKSNLRVLFKPRMAIYDVKCGSNTFDTCSTTVGIMKDGKFYNWYSKSKFLNKYYWQKKIKYYVVYSRLGAKCRAVNINLYFKCTSRSTLFALKWQINFAEFSQKAVLLLTNVFFVYGLIFGEVINIVKIK